MTKSTTIGKKFTIRGATSKIKDGVGMYFGVNGENSNNNNNGESEEPYWMQDSFWEKQTPNTKKDVEMQPFPDSPPAYSPPRPKSQYNENNNNDNLDESDNSRVIIFNNLENSNITMNNSHTGIIGNESGNVVTTSLDYYPPNVILDDDNDNDNDDDRRGRGRGKGRGRGRGRGASNNTSSKHQYQQQIDSNGEVLDGAKVPARSGGHGRVSTLGRGVSSLSLKDEHKGLGPPPERFTPYFIISISIFNAILLVWEIILNGGFEAWKYNPWFGPSVYTLLDAGAKYTPLILEGEWWRFFTPIFLHVGIFHLLMNLVTQIRVGMQLERAYGAHRIIPIYLLCGVMGNLSSAVMLPLSIQVGASGAIFGFLGVLLADLVRNWGSLARPYLNCCSLVFTIVISFAVGLFLPGVDNYAHLGGFVMGILTGFIFLPSLTPKRALGKRLCLILIAIPLTITIFVVLFVVFYKRIDSAEWCPNCQNFTCLKFLSWCQN